MNLNESFWQISKKKKKKKERKKENWIIQAGHARQLALLQRWRGPTPRVHISTSMITRSCWECHVLPAAMSKTASRASSSSPCRSFTKRVTASRLEAIARPWYSSFFFLFPSLGLLRALRWQRPLVVCWTLRSHGELAPPKILEKKEEVPRWNPQCRTLGQDRWVPRRRGFIRSLGFSCLRRNAFFEAATGTPAAKQRRISRSRA